MPPTLPNTLANGTTADASQVMADLNAINAAVDQVTVTSLPGSPYDGQEVYYLADATNGIVWHLKYRSGSASASKWECVGGLPLIAGVNAEESLATTGSYQNLATAGPSITVPLTGDYEAQMGCYGVIPAAGRTLGMGIGIGNTDALGRTVTLRSSDIAYPDSVPLEASLMTQDRIAFTAADVAKARYEVIAGTCSFGYRWVALRPVRVH